MPDLPADEHRRPEAAARDLQDTYLAIDDGYESFVDSDALGELLD